MKKCSKGDRLIGYRYFLINDEEYEVNSLYYFRESAIERKLDFNHDNNAPILVYDNSLPYFKELLRSNINKSLRENICLVSETEINDFADENAEELNRLYEHYSNTYNKCASVSGGYLKPLCSPKKHNECTSDDKKQLKLFENKKTEDKPNKTIIRDYELEEGNYQICTCYLGEDKTIDILVKSDITTDNNLKTTCRVSFNNLYEDDLSMTTLKTYTKRFINEDDYSHNFDIFLIDTEIKFSEDYNVIEARNLKQVLEEEYGKQQIYTIEQIKNVLATNRKNQAKQKVKSLTGKY